MKKILLFTLSVFILLQASCTEKTRKKTDKEPNVNMESIESNFKNWWFYYSKNIILSSDFTALDQNTKIIPKNDFLEKLTTGNFIPLKLRSKNDTIYYQLFKLGKNADKGISGTIKNVSKRAYQYFKMEGTSFPEFNFTDLKGNHYNNINTKGKIVILKCWFISCKPCVAEFPQLNQLVKQYQNREDVLFISLAFDSKKELSNFLIKKPFGYAVVPNQKDFMDQH